MFLGAVRTEFLKTGRLRLLQSFEGERAGPAEGRRGIARPAAPAEVGTVFALWEVRLQDHVPLQNN